MSVRLDRASLAVATDHLVARDVRLARVVARHGAPPLWGRPSGFATLVRIILEQQVSLASGRAAFDRLARVAGAVTPQRVARLDPGDLRAAGLTRQKAGYVAALARAVVDGAFDPARIARLDDGAARAALVELRGIGPWSADIYLLMALRRADVWPSGDLALQIAAREVLRLRSAPTPAKLDAIAERWRPYRSVAARILWHHYLRTRTRGAARGPVRTRTQGTQYCGRGREGPLAAP